VVKITRGIGQTKNLRPVAAVMAVTGLFVLPFLPSLDGRG